MTNDEAKQEEQDIKKAEDVVKHWLGEISDSQEREKAFRKTGRKVNKIYEVETKEENQFNILYSNTETLLPALYNNQPRPVVERRFKDEDPLGKTASKVTERLLAFFIENDNREYEPFSELMVQSVLEALLPGRGLVRFKYHADFEAVPPAAEGEKPGEKVSYETVCGEQISWDNILFGYSKTWQKLPWAAIEHFMDKGELKENFPDIEISRVELTAKGAKAPGEGEGDDKADDDKAPDMAQVFEIWDKKKRKVVFVSPGYKDGPLKETDDPLGLSGFFPFPEPLSFTKKVTGGAPIALYLFYEDQAKELNRITMRINKIVSAMKVRGFYNGNLGDLSRVLEAGDNTLIATDKNGIGAQDITNLSNEIWLMPLEKLIQVLQQLYVQRQQVKTVIYEITGISDILRGSSVASETATAQEIKNQWGTLRLKRGQKTVMRFVRDSLRIIAEIAVTKLSQETIAAMTGLQYPTNEQKAQGQQVIAQLQASGQQPPPQLVQGLSMPSWEDILGLLKNDLTRDYRIDIETNSTVDAEATEDKANLTEFLNAISQFMNGVGPMVSEGIMPFEAAKAMLLAVTRRYRFGTEVEDLIQQMTAPKPQGDGQAEAAKAAGEQAKAKSEQEKMAMEGELAKAEHAMRMEEMQAEGVLKRQELALKERELALKTEDLARKAEYNQQAHAMKLQTMAAQAAMPKKGE